MCNADYNLPAAKTHDHWHDTARQLRPVFCNPFIAVAQKTMPTAKPTITVRPPQAAAAEALQRQGLAALPAQVLAARGITRRADIVPPLAALPPPAVFNGITAMARRLVQAIANDETIYVVGDYDVDGVAATVILVSCLRQMNANVHWKIPERDGGYGLSPGIVEAAIADGAQIILTADNGINAHAAVSRAHELGACVCVTDHHRPDDDQPCAADHVINPHFNNNDDLANLCGAGVAFYLMAEMRTQLGTDIPMKDYLDLLALATVADCVPMDAVNRSLVGGGIDQIRDGKGGMRPGIAALCDVARLYPPQLTSRDISFRLAPRINAAGRMNRAHDAVTGLLADDPKVARRQAAIMQDANQQRILRQKEILAMARTLVDPTAAGIVVADPDWESGIVGIIAGVLSAKYHRPAIVLCQHGNGDNGWRGSARAPETYDLHQLLADIDAAHPDVIRDFGGHRQAAGVLVEKNQLDAFTAAFNDGCAAVGAPPPQRLVDAATPALLTATAAKQLEDVPWGIGFLRPQFYGSFAVTQVTPLNGGHLKMLLQGDGKTFQAVQFNISTTPLLGDNINIIYGIALNPYNDALQIQIEDVMT